MVWIPTAWGATPRTTFRLHRCEATDYNPMVSGAMQHSRLRFVENSRLCRRCAFYIPFPRVSLSLNPRLLNRCRSPVLRTQSPQNVLRHYIDTTGCIDTTSTSLLHHSDNTPTIYRLCIDITPTTFVWYGFQLHRVRLLGLHSDCIGAKRQTTIRWYRVRSTGERQRFNNRGLSEAIPSESEHPQSQRL